MLPSSCCRIIINTINHKALTGSTIKIITAPNAVPINAPTSGINAVNPINVDIIVAYGIENIFIPIKHNKPIIIASVSCPVTNLEKVTPAILAILKIDLTVSSFK